MARRNRCWSAIGLMVLVGCGDGSSNTVPIATSESTSIPTSPSSIVGELPALGVLSVVDGCAQVVSVDGHVWADSCMQPLSSPEAVVFETIGDVELALIRVYPGVEMVSGDPATVRFVQADGWVLVESPAHDFTMTFRAEGRADAVCLYNPFFIDCDGASIGDGPIVVEVPPSSSA